jgi:hypothetical protein
MLGRGEVVREREKFVSRRNAMNLNMMRLYAVCT